MYWGKSFIDWKFISHILKKIETITTEYNFDVSILGQKSKCTKTCLFYQDIYHSMGNRKGKNERFALRINNHFSDLAHLSNIFIRDE